MYLKINAQALIRDEDDYPDIDLKGHTIEELAAFANVTVDVIKAAIKMRKQQMKKAQRNAIDGNKKTALSNELPPSLSTLTQKNIARSVPTASYTTPKRKYLTKGHKVWMKFNQFAWQF